MRTYRILLTTDAEASGANTETPPAAKSPGTTEELSILIKKNADLEKDNKKYRDSNKDLRAELATAKSATPSLPADVESELAAYRAFGKPEEIKAGLSEASQLKRDKEIHGVATAAGYDPEVLATLAGSLTFEVKEEDSEDKKSKVKVAYVKAGPDKTIPLADFASANWSKFLPALKPTEPEKPKPNGTPNRSIPTTPIVPDPNAASRSNRMPMATI